MEKNNHEVRKCPVHNNHLILKNYKQILFQAVTAVVMAVLSSQALAYLSYYRPQGYSMSSPNFYENAIGSKLSFSNHVCKFSKLYTYFKKNIKFQNVSDMDPAILTESTDVLLNTIERTNEMIDNLPRMDETARQMSDLWAIAYPQLKTLLSKAGAWANQIPVPGRRKRSPQFFYQQGGNDAFNQIASDVMQCEFFKLYTYIHR